MEKEWKETTNLIDESPKMAAELKALLKKQKDDGRTILHRSD